MLKKPALKIGFIFQLLWLVLLVTNAHSRPNFNIDTLAFRPISGTEGCWGYVDSATNREYALICASNRLEIWDVTDPSNPVQKPSVPATGGDLKQVRPYSHYAFAVNQQDSGLQVIDLSDPENAYTLTSYATLSNHGGAHAIHIDGHYAYLGMNGNSPYSWRVIDIFDPLDLQPQGQYMTSQPGGGYLNILQSHDSFVKGDTAYIAFLSAGFSIVDISIKNLPKKIADVVYPDAFTHNCWPAEDGQYLFTTDEIPGTGHLRVWDIRDPANPVQVAEWMPTGIASIIHNVQVKGIYAYISYYADGVVILDIEDPTQPVEVGHYDTAPQSSSTGFAGCWDFFPYFPSGTLLASNYSSPAGMWLLHFNGAKAGQITGRIVNFLTDEPLRDVSIRVLNAPRQSKSDPTGNFFVRTDSGAYRLEFSLADFLPETLTVSGRLNDTADIGTVALKPTSILPATPSGFTVWPMDGGNIHLAWQPPTDTGLSGFHIYRTAPNDTSLFALFDSTGPNASTYVDTGSIPGERFSYRIAAINRSGYASLLTRTVKSMRFVFGQKLLLVDRTAYCAPYLKRFFAAPDSFYSFHARMLRRFDFDTLDLNDCTVRFAVNPTFVSRHPYIVLHSSEFFTPLTHDNASFLSFFSDYLKAGGKLLVEAQWTPLQPNPVTLCDFNSVLLPGANTEIWDTVRSAFGFDCLYYPLVHTLNNSTVHQGFAGAQSKSAEYPHLTVDSFRVDYFVPTTGTFTRYPYPTLPNVGYLTGIDSSENLYAFNSLLGNSDEKHGKAVAKKRINPDGGGFVWFDFPLYYMKEDSAKKAFRQAMADLGVPETFPKGDFDRDGVRTIEDVTYLMNWVFLGEPFPVIFDASETDLNCDGGSSPADLVLLLLNVFPGQPLPCN